MKRKTTLFMSMMFTLIGLTSMAQSYNMGTAGTRTVTGCNLTIYDNGGASGNYGNNRNDTMTILSGTPGTPSVLITIEEGDISADDTLFVYNSNTCDPSSLVYFGAFPYYNNSNQIVLGDWSTFATINNPSGAITLRFKSNGSNVGPGFKITTSCQAPCQRINAFIDTVASYPHPHRLTPDDGYLYIDLCQDSAIHLVGNATFIDNNFAYPQSMDSCHLSWNLGDIDVNSPMGTNFVNHTYISGRGYNVALTVNDQRNCFNLNSAIIRVRTSLNPISQVTPLSDMCSGTSKLISVGYGTSSNIQVIPVSSVQESSLSFDSTMNIPDGPNCPGADCYNTYVTFNSFLPGQTITNAADILSVCFTMEHTYLGDLQFRVICPNGSNVMTHAQHSSISDNLGAAITGVSPNCSPDISLSGTGWNYCWSEYPGYSYHGTTTTHYLYEDQNDICDSTNRTNHTNYYKPENSFSNLIGCPLNGTWSIEICDLYGADDGWIFQWQLNLDPSLLPTPWSYTVGINNVLWNGAFLTQQSDTTALLSPSTGGQFDYTFSVVDDFGCGFDSIIHLTVIETPAPNLGNDTSFCEGTILTLNPHYGIAGSTYQWNDFTNDPTTSVTSPGTYMVTITNSSTSIQCTNSDTINISQYPQPVADFTATPIEGCSPLIVQFNDTSTPNTLNYTYAWDFGDPAAQINTSVEKNPQHIYTQYGNFDVSLLVTSQDGCSATITKPGLITVHPTPKARFTPNPETASLSDNPTITFTNQTENFILSETSWFWNFQDGSTSTDMNPSHTYTSPNDFNVYLVARNSYGCKDSVFHTVIIEDELFIPNILTPDGDNNNDFLVIGNLNMNRENVLKIYDRWGKKVYEKKNYNTSSLCQKMNPEGTKWSCEDVINADQGWNGEGCPDGVYFYTFHYEGVIKTVDKNGTITIVGSKY